MDKQQMLDILSTMPVEEFSCAMGECEYVLTKETDKKVEALREMGMSDKDYETMTNAEGYIDIAYFAFAVLGAEWWSKNGGFALNREIESLETQGWFFKKGDVYSSPYESTHFKITKIVASDEPEDAWIYGKRVDPNNYDEDLTEAEESHRAWYFNENFCLETP